MSESDLEKPVPDSVDQAREVADEADAEEPQESQPSSLPLDVNEADAVEQRREVRLDEDDYR